VFLSVLAGFVLILVLNTYRTLPVVNSKFDLHKTEAEYLAHAPIVDLNTPQLVAGNKTFNQCIACHGKGGEGKASQKAPHIGGQYDWYVEKQLTDMKSGARINAAMVPIVKGLTAEDIKNVAAYVTLLPWNKEKYMADQKAASTVK
jgi:cytochrome c553